jgi:hypothetical protein
MPVNNVGDGVVNYAPTRNPFNYDKFYQLSRALTVSWLTLEEITQQLNLFGDESQDAYLEGLELAVRMAIEDYLGVPIFPITYRVYYGSSALYGSPLTLDLPEVSQSGVTINNVKYYNLSNVLTTVAPSSYFFDPTGNKVVLSNLPTDLSPNMTSPVVCEYTVNASILAQYPVIKQAGLLLFTHLYNNRSDTNAGSLSKIPFGVDVLLRPYKDLVM